jgi:hypothetical protein
MSKEHDEVTDLVTRAALQAKLELVADELERAIERLSTVIAEIKNEGNGGADDRPGVDQSPQRSD